MFEKEAEEYAIDNYETCSYDVLPYASDFRAREQSFKDGAEFGYNKAKADLEKQIEKMKADVRTNIKVAEQSENNQMYFKLNSMINQWELAEN